MSLDGGGGGARRRLGLFQGFGIEIEYMIVDRTSLDVKPLADRLMAKIAGEPASEVDRGTIAWSNELVLHVLEMKTNGPAVSLAGLSGRFHDEVREANAALASLDAMLLPGGAHPWMDPTTETRLWPHEHNEVYRAFDRIFSCQGHGWANLQATHLNLPFQGDAELRALHTAIRAVLPLLPALAASSPILDGAAAGSLDRRMIEYRKNSRRVPSVAGQVVPDVVASRAEYEERILGPIYFDLAPHDPEGILRHEWVNARGAIARFERGTVEIRVLDVQECPAADVALVGAVCRVVHGLCARILDGDDRAYRLRTDELSALLDVVVRDAERACVDSSEYQRVLGLPQARRRSAGEVWQELLEGSEPGPWEASASARDAEGGDPLGAILGEGPLGRRILARLGPRPCREELREVYRELADCLASNRIFHGP